MIKTKTKININDTTDYLRGIGFTEEETEDILEYYSPEEVILTSPKILDSFIG